MQISCENIDLLLSANFSGSVYESMEHKLQAQAGLEKIWGKDMGRFATMQRKILPKAYKKIPTWYAHQCFFTPKSYEQSTAEAVAMFKSGLIKGRRLLSLTGGLGVDDWAFSQTFDSVVSLDTDDDLNCLVRINFEKLGIKNYTRLDTEAETYLSENTEAFDCFYIDPDRRAADESKGLDAQLFSPNILDLLKEFPAIQNNLWIKLSPATDITWISENIDKKIDLYIIEWQGEVKEILCHIHGEMSGLLQVCVLPNFCYEKDTPIDKTKFPDEILFEPSAALIKSHMMASEFGTALELDKLNDDFTLYKSHHILPHVLGKQGIIISRGTEGFKQVKKEMLFFGISKASVTCRSYPLKPTDIMKKLKLKESAEYQLYFTSSKGKKMWFLIKKLKM
jgi:hypothetical protein